MSKQFVRALLFLLLTAYLYIVSAQQAILSDEVLLEQYKRAQVYYDKATALSKLESYGPKEEALEQAWNKKALEGFTSIYSVFKKEYALYDSLRFYTSFKIGELHHYFENFSAAVNFYKEAIAIKQKSKLPDSLLFKPYLYAGIIFYNQNKFDTAVQFFKNAENIQANYSNELAEAERLYNILGVLFYERGNYKQAQNYFRKALVLLSVTNPYYKELYVNYNINLAQLHLRLEEYDKANQIYLSLLPLQLNTNEIYHNIGSLNLSLGAAEKALVYFRKVNYQNNKVVRLYNSIGEAFFNLKNFDSALHYYYKASQAYTTLGANADPISFGLVQKNMGDYYRHFKQNDQAFQHYQRAIIKFYPAFLKEDIHSNPEKFSGVFSYINLFNVLNAKAELWHDVYQQKQQDLTAAKEELKTYESAFKLIEYVERTYDSDEARLFLTKIKHAVHGKPIDIAFDLYSKTNNKTYLETLYHFDQQNKAAVLSLNRQLNTLAAEAPLPEQQEEQRLKAEITRLSIRAAQAQDSLQLQKINGSIRDYEIALGKIQEKRTSTTSLRGGNIPSLKTVQEKLSNSKTTLVSYHLSENRLTTLVVTNTNASAYQQPLPPGFDGMMQQEIKRLRTPTDNLTEKQGVNFFGLFFRHISLAETEQLIIIPDDVLAYFPFESLKTNDGNYLIENVAIQYQYSTALLQENKTDFSSAKTLAFAPFGQQSISDSLPTLPASIDEVSNIKGKKLIDSGATKAAFLEESKNYRIVHLATHAFAGTNNQLPYIVFYGGPANNDKFLYTQEIYNLQFSGTSLVILSACETGSGELVKGEGVLSLSRAFSYAGCPNIITSLWKANDFSTAYLSKRIHYYLNDGRSISKSVQLAKKDYLADKAINPRLKQPYYWAHLVFVGDYEVPGSAPLPWLILVFGLLALAIAVYLIKKPGKARR